MTIANVVFYIRLEFEMVNFTVHLIVVARKIQHFVCEWSSGVE